MFRRMILTVALGTAAVFGLAMTPASADAHPRGYEPVRHAVYHPVFVRHHELIGPRIYVQPPIVIARPVYPAPIVVTPAPIYVPAPTICPR